MGKGFKNRSQHCGVLSVASLIAPPYLRLHGAATTAKPCKDMQFQFPLAKKKKDIYLYI